MGPYLQANLMSAGGCAFAGGYYGWLWVQSRRELVLLLFSLLCVIMAIHCTILAALADAQTAAEAQAALNLRTTNAAVTLILLTWVSAASTGVRARWYVWTITVVMAGIALCNQLVFPINGAVAGIERATLPWGEQISVPLRSAPPGWWLVPIYAAGTSIGLFTLIGARKLVKTDRIAGSFVAIVGVLYLGSALVSLLVDLYRLPLPYAPAPTLIAWLMFMGLVVSREYRRRSERLVAFEHRLARFFASSPDAIMIARLDDGKIMAVNPAFVDIFGWTADKAVGRTAGELALWESSEEGEDFIARVRAQRTLLNVETPLRRRGGQVGTGLISCSVVEVDGVDCAQMTIRDITGLRRAEDLLRRNERLTALGTLAGGVAHDLNNVLSVIVGNVGLLRQGPSAARIEECANRISVASRQMENLTAALLRFVRQGSGIPALYDAHEAIRTAVTLFHTAARGVTVDLSGLAAGSPMVRGWRGLLQNAILNLSLNSRDAMGGVGRIAITSAVRELDREAAAGLQPYHLAAGAYLEIAVADHGIGMDAETLRRCFQPFFTTKGEHGTGLGLASVHSAVIEHHGAVTVQSAPGRGATFTLWLPLS